MSTRYRHQSCQWYQHVQHDSNQSKHVRVRHHRIYHRNNAFFFKKSFYLHLFFVAIISMYELPFNEWTSMIETRHNVTRHHTLQLCRAYLQAHHRHVRQPQLIVRVRASHFQRTCRKQIIRLCRCACGCNETLCYIRIKNCFFVGVSLPNTIGSWMRSSLHLSLNCRMALIVDGKTDCCWSESILNWEFSIFFQKKKKKT